MKPISPGLTQGYLPKVVELQWMMYEDHSMDLVDYNGTVYAHLEPKWEALIGEERQILIDGVGLKMAQEMTREAVGKNFKFEPEDPLIPSFP